MELTLRIGGGERIVKVEGDSPKALFEEAAAAYEVFNETECGLCKSNDIKIAHRCIDKYHYYEYQCNGCRAYLHMAQLQDGSGGLFPVRKLLPNGKPHFRDGKFGPHNGWTTYRGDDLRDAQDERNTHQQQRTESSDPFSVELSRFVAQVKKQTGVTEERDVDKILSFSMKQKGINVRNVVESRLPVIQEAYAKMLNRFRESMARAAELWDFLCVGGLDPADSQGASIICQWIMGDEGVGFATAVANPDTFKDLIKRLGDWYTMTPPNERNQMLDNAKEWKAERQAVKSELLPPPTLT